MKLTWMREEEKLIPVKIVHRGVERELLLHHLSAADIDEADRKFPLVKAPQLLGDDGKPIRDDHGLPKLDETGAEFITAAIERAVNHASHLVALALGAEAFETREIDEQIKELRREFTRTAIITMRDAILTDAMLTPALLEAAKDGVRPTGSSA